MSFERAEFEAMMTSTLTVSTWSSFNSYGDASYSTAASTFNCRISETPTRVMSFEGEEVVAKTILYVASTVAINATDLITLADGSTPPLMHIDRVYDDDGLHHNVVYVGRG